MYVHLSHYPPLAQGPPEAGSGRGYLRMEGWLDGQTDGQIERQIERWMDIKIPPVLHRTLYPFRGKALLSSKATINNKPMKISCLCVTGFDLQS